MQPESCDGLASVGTILPKEGAALFPGGSFRFCGLLFVPLWRARTGSRIDPKFEPSDDCRRRLIGRGSERSQPLRHLELPSRHIFLRGGMSPCEARVVDAFIASM